MWKDVFADFSDLPKHEQQTLFELLKEEFFFDADKDMKDAFTSIRETRFTQKAGTGRVRAEEINAVIGNFIDPSSLLCTDTATNYKIFALMKELKHETVNLSKEGYVKKGIYHLQFVNSYHKRLKDWMQRFQGVATSYLDNYLYRFNFVQQSKKMAPQELVNQMLLSACQKSNLITVKYLREV
jgi:hypothetical protein